MGTSDQYDPGRYILDEEGNPVPEPDLFKWATWLETADRKLERTEFSDDTYVSTVFLGVDYNFGLGPVPVLWETMIRDKGKWRDDQWRYTSKEEAIEGHKNAVEILKRRIAHRERSKQARLKGNSHK